MGLFAQFYGNFWIFSQKFEAFFLNTFGDSFWMGFSQFLENFGRFSGNIRAVFGELLSSFMGTFGHFYGTF